MKKKYNKYSVRTYVRTYSKKLSRVYILSYAQYTYSVHCTFLVALGQVAYGLIVTEASSLLAG
jgi:hypothetical protein